MTDVAGRLRGNYFDLLARIHKAVRPRTYVEVGMHTGRSLELAVPETLILGIDPVPAVRTKINDTAQLFFETSDDFFANHDVAALLGGRPIDLAFIDGMHLFEFALRDFRNIERNAATTSTVMVHDCFPLDAASATRERGGDTWTGDTWKLVPCLRELRPDLEIITVAVKPSGLTIIRGLDPTSTVLWDRYDEALARFGNMKFAEIEGRQETALNVVANDWDAIAAHLPDSPFAPAGSMPAATPRFPMRWPVLRHQSVRLAKVFGRRVIDLVTRRR